MREKYGTGNYALERTAFWQSMKISIPRAISRISVVGCWALIAHLMMTKGEMHLLVLCIGSTVVSSFLFINEGVCQAMITIASNLLGLKAWDKIWKLVRSAGILLILNLLLLSIPLLFYPHALLPYFFKELPSPEKMEILCDMCGWLWILFLANGVSLISFSLITAAKDTFFLMCTNALIWVTTLPLVYWGIGMQNWPAGAFWVILAFEPIFISSILFLRLRREKWKIIDPAILERS